MTTYLYIIGAPGAESCAAKVGITESPITRFNQIFTCCPRRRLLASEGIELFALYRFEQRSEAQTIERMLFLLNQWAKSDPRTLGWLVMNPRHLATQVSVLTNYTAVNAEKVNCTFTRLELEVLEESSAA